jgi:rRNA-processing protein FCF1
MFGLSLTNSDIEEIVKQIPAQLLEAALALQNASDIKVVKKTLRDIHGFCPVNLQIMQPLLNQLDALSSSKIDKQLLKDTVYYELARRAAVWEEPSLSFTYFRLISATFVDYENIWTVVSNLSDNINNREDRIELAQLIRDKIVPALNKDNLSWRQLHVRLYPKEAHTTEVGYRVRKMAIDDNCYFLMMHEFRDAYRFLRSLPQRFDSLLPHSEETQKQGKSSINLNVGLFGHSANSPSIPQAVVAKIQSLQAKIRGSSFEIPDLPTPAQHSFMVLQCETTESYINSTLQYLATHHSKLPIFAQLKNIQLDLQAVTELLAARQSDFTVLSTITPDDATSSPLPTAPLIS